MLRETIRINKPLALLAKIRQNWSGAVLAKMTREAQERLRPLAEKVVGVFCAASGTNSYEDAIAWLRSQFQDKSTSPAPWLHKMAREITSTMFPGEPPDTVDPNRFYEILGVIDTREKVSRIVKELPEEDEPKIKSFLNFLLKDFFPSVREGAGEMVTVLPQRRSGPKKPWKMPGEEKCREICQELERLDRQHVKKGIAQERVSAKFGLSVRMVQRIASERDKYLPPEPET